MFTPRLLRRRPFFALSSVIGLAILAGGFAACLNQASSPLSSASTADHSCSDSSFSSLDEQVDAGVASLGQLPFGVYLLQSIDVRAESIPDNTAFRAEGKETVSPQGDRLDTVLACRSGTDPKPNFSSKVHLLQGFQLNDNGSSESIFRDCAIIAQTADAQMSGTTFSCNPVPIQPPRATSELQKELSISWEKYGFVQIDPQTFEWRATVSEGGYRFYGTVRYSYFSPVSSSREVVSSWLKQTTLD